MRFTDPVLTRKIAELTLKHSNLPESFIRRITEIVEYKAPKLPQYRQITRKRYKNYYDVDRPWSSEFQLYNYPFVKLPKTWVEPIKDWSFFKGDRVEVLTGRDKGKQGIVIKVVQERNWVLVQGLNLYYYAVKQKGVKVIVHEEAPLLINREVSLVDPSDLKPTNVEWRYDSKGNRVRVSLRTGLLLPIPILEEETFDYKLKSAYHENEKDTKNTEISKVTFVPTLATFEMDLMREYGIKEDRVPAETYWY